MLLLWRQVAAVKSREGPASCISAMIGDGTNRGHPFSRPLQLHLLSRASGGCIPTDSVHIASSTQLLPAQSNQTIVLYTVHQRVQSLFLSPV